MAEAFCLPPVPADSEDALMQNDQIRVIDAAGRPLGTAVAADEMVLAETEQQEELGNEKGAENDEDEQNQQNQQNQQNEQNEQNEQGDSKEVVGDESVERNHSSQDEPGENSNCLHQNHHPPETELPDGESQKEGGVPFFEDSSAENYDQSELSSMEQRLLERAEKSARLYVERKQQQEYERQMRAGNEKEPDNEPATEP
eukprot:gene12944-14936_t